MIRPFFLRLFDGPDYRAYRDLTVVEPAALSGWLVVVSGIAALDSWRGQPSCHLRPVLPMRRAVAFIDEHAHEDITIADIAAAAHVTIRAVQLAFRRHLGTTPTGYLRRVRLDYAHHDLIAADPARDSVTVVAYRWGFPSPSRFAAYYRTTYGVPPGDTLRRR